MVLTKVQHETQRENQMGGEPLAVWLGNLLSHFVCKTRCIELTPAQALWFLSATARGFFKSICWCRKSQVDPKFYASRKNLLPVYEIDLGCRWYQHGDRKKPNDSNGNGICKTGILLYFFCKNSMIIAWFELLFYDISFLSDSRFISAMKELFKEKIAIIWKYCFKQQQSQMIMYDIWFFMPFSICIITHYIDVSQVPVIANATSSCFWNS